MTAAALLVVLGAALLMELGGLSMAMGAFVAGVLLSESTSATSWRPTSSPSAACCWACSSWRRHVARPGRGARQLAADRWAACWR
jgi:hypothetical protein